MGEEIGGLHFEGRDFPRFRRRLREETELVERWSREGKFAEDSYKVGFELEAWLTDARYRPAPANERFIEAMASPYVVPELARFNVEINGPELSLEGGAFAMLHRSLRHFWGSCRERAAQLGLHLLMIGTNPAVEDGDLSLETISAPRRYRALNEQVLRLRRGRPLVLDIRGREHLRLTHRDLVFESAATSFQVHLQVPASKAARAYNLAVLLSAPTVAAAANAPFLFGRDLWAETRIPLFEQAVATDPPRVGMGEGYVGASVAECFRENLERHPPLLPELIDDPPEALHHLRLHNGTIWRWNRPLVGFDDGGRPHLRIEHRVLSAGPTVADMVAGAAFFCGMAVALLEEGERLEERIPFEQARRNFYLAAREGLEAEVAWSGGRLLPLRRLILDELLPLARKGLALHGVGGAETEEYLGIVEERVRSGRCGARWQRDYREHRGATMTELTAAYHARQESDLPVHLWPL